MSPLSQQTNHCGHGLMLVFDAVGTVLRANPDVFSVYRELGQRHGVGLTLSDLQSRWHAAWAQWMEKRADVDAGGIAGITSQYAERCFWRQFVHTVFAPAPGLDALFEDLWEHFAQPSHWELYDDVLPAWEELVRAGHSIHVASNFDARLRDIARRWFPSSLVQNVWNSGDIGWRKPSRYFFDHIQNALRVPTNQLVYIGDDGRCDTTPARALGWRAVQIDRGSEPRTAPARAVVRTLNDLPGWVSAFDPTCCPPAGNYTEI